MLKYGQSRSSIYKIRQQTSKLDPIFINIKKIIYWYLFFRLMENVYCMYLLNFALVQNELTRTGRTVQSPISAPKENKKAEGILSSENLALMWIQVCRNYIAVRKLILYFVKLKLNNRTSLTFDLIRDILWVAWLFHFLPHETLGFTSRSSVIFYFQ